MKLTLSIELEIEGECSEDFVRENFVEWFNPPPKVSPEAYDDDFIVWVRSWEVL